jgi:hypothetical protein
MDQFKAEPWLRGPIEDVSPWIAPILYSFQMAREDVARHTEGLTAEQLWMRPQGIASAGFHIRHIGGSVDRLTTYVEGRQLSESQMTALKTETEPGASRQELLAGMNAALERAEQLYRQLDPDHLTEARFVGRKQLPTTVIGLLIHIAEHTQRHTGQCVTTAKLVRNLNS